MKNSCAQWSSNIEEAEVTTVGEIITITFFFWDLGFFSSLSYKTPSSRISSIYIRHLYCHLLSTK